MKTPATEDFPEIEWEVTREVLERDPEERLVVYLAKGVDDLGNKYAGSAHYTCDELDAIKDICQE